MLWTTRLTEDWYANAGNPKGRLIVVLFRIAHEASKWTGVAWLPGRIVGVAYRVVVEWVLGVELPWKLVVGGGLRVFHGQGTVINDGSRLGSDIVIRHGLTIGHVRPGGGCPFIEDRVEFGANATVIGPIRIGHDSKIGPGVVLRDSVPPFTVVTAPPPVVRFRSEPKSDYVV